MLVAYASNCGSTRGVAERVSARLGHRRSSSCATRIFIGTLRLPAWLLGVVNSPSTCDR